MKKIYIICLFFFFLSCSKNEQPKNIEKKSQDSLSIYLRLANNKNLKPINKTKYLNKALNIVVNQKNDSITRDHLLEITSSFYKDSNWKYFIKSSSLLFKKAKEKNDTVNIAQYFKYKAGYYKYKAINDSAFIYYLKSEKLFRNLKDNLNLGSVLTNKSIIQYSIGDLVGADQSLTQAYKLLKNGNNNEKLYVIFTMMGIVANETKDYNKAIDYYKKSIKIIKQNNINDGYQEAACLNNIGYAYQNKADFVEAINNYKLALRDITIINNDPELYSLLIDNLAYCKFKLKNYEGLPDLFYESLKVREKIDAKTLIVLSKIHLSEYYYVKNDFTNSKQFANEALTLAKSTDITRDFLAALKQSSSVDHENASKYSSDYIRISDSIQDVERNSKEKFSRLELETDEIIESNTQLEERNRNLLYFFVVSAILLGFLFIIRTQRAKTRELVLKQAQQKANEDIYNLMIAQQTVIDESRAAEKKRIARELHDGVLGRMFGARLNLDSLNTSSDEESVQKRFNYLFELKNIEQDLREISHDLNREKTVLINNFVSIVNNLLEEQKASFESNVVNVIDETIKWDKIHNTIKINLYRILQEGLQNINKYAKAKNIKVEIKGDDDNLRLFIEDDGAGFEVNKKSKGIGLQNMISRTNECHGIFDIKSEKGKGTSIEITIPYENNKIKTEQE